MATRGWAAIVLAFAIGAMGCNGPHPPPPTIEEVLEVCLAYQEAVCSAFAECQQWGDGQTDECLADGESDCRTNIEFDDCRQEQFDRLEECEDYVSSHSCDAVCGESFCFHRCYWSCPS